MRTTLRRVYLPGTAVTAHSRSNLLAGSDRCWSCRAEAALLIRKRRMTYIERRFPFRQALPFPSSSCFVREGNDSRYGCTRDSGSRLSRMARIAEG